MSPEQIDAIVRELQISTPLGRLKLVEGAAVVAKLLELGFIPSAPSNIFEIRRIDQ